MTSIYELLSSVLNIGNIDFDSLDDGAASSAKQSEYLATAARILQVDAKVLEESMTLKALKVCMSMCMWLVGFFTVLL